MKAPVDDLPEVELEAQIPSWSSVIFTFLASAALIVGAHHYVKNTKSEHEAKIGNLADNWR